MLVLFPHSHLSWLFPPMNPRSFTLVFRPARHFRSTSLLTSQSYHTPHSCRPSARALKPVRTIVCQKRHSSNMSDDQAPHQFQSGDTTHREEDQWKTREPYRIHEKMDNFPIKWEGSCHCGKVTYQLSREKPLAAKYCHCTTCQRLHGVSDQSLAVTLQTDSEVVTISVGSDLSQVRHQLHQRHQ